jgi:hypothetical protein
MARPTIVPTLLGLYDPVEVCTFSSGTLSRVLSSKHLLTGVAGSPGLYRALLPIVVRNSLDYYRLTSPALSVGYSPNFTE